MTLLLLACTGLTLPSDDTNQPIDTEALDDSSPSDDTGDSGSIEYDCSNLPELPADMELLEGFTGSEDFAFDGEGYLVSVDDNGNLVRIDQDGHKELVVPGLGYTAGTHVLSTGEMVIADVERGRVVRVGLDGSVETLLGGLSYPNGVTVDAEDVVYVAEHDAGRVRSVPGQGGDDTVIATGLFNPNGLAFSTDWQTLYVGSFGGGTVHAIDREGSDWAEPRLFSEVESMLVDPCVELSDGTSCFIPEGGLGVCDAGTCELDLDQAACDGKDAGEACTTLRLETQVESQCRANDAGLFCPRVDEQRISVCESKAPWDSCKVGNNWGTCLDTWEGYLSCVTDQEQWQAMTRPCDDLAVGEACISDFPTGAYEGECTDYSDWGWGVICDSPSLWGGGGGLDGLGVDACDNVYVTEYVLGLIWRFDPDGSNQQMVADTGSFWIPNMHWGNGIGGWEKDVLYVMDRDSYGVFALELGVPGAPTAYNP